MPDWSLGKAQVECGFGQASITVIIPVEGRKKAGKPAVRPKTSAGF
jgi:hypothetical protein